MIKEKSCGIVVFRQGKSGVNYLILHYGAGHWDFSKGHVEKGEDEIQTALRELKEETGIEKINLEENFREKIEYFFRRGKELVRKEVIFFLGETQEKKVKISFEHEGYKWCDYESALKKLTFQTAKNILKKANKFLEEREKQKKLAEF